MTKKNDVSHLDNSTLQMMQTLMNPEQIDSIEFNVSKALEKHNESNELKNPSQDLKAVAPTSALPAHKKNVNEAVTIDTFYKASNERFASLDSLVTRQEKIEQHSSTFKKCARDLRHHIANDHSATVTRNTGMKR